MLPEFIPGDAVANANVKTPVKEVMTNAVDVTLGGWR